MKLNDEEKFLLNLEGLLQILHKERTKHLELKVPGHLKIRAEKIRYKFVALINEIHDAVNAISKHMEKNR